MPRVCALALSIAWACGGGGQSGPVPAGDTTPPAVLWSSPAAGQVGVSNFAAITVTFSEPISPATLNALTFLVTDVGAQRRIGGAISCSGATATFIPDAPLAYSGVYTATLTTGVADLAGNPLASAWSCTFTAAPAPDLSPPAVMGTSPAAGAGQVPVSAPVTATFSEAMDPTSLTTATFSLLDAGGGRVPGTVTSSGTTATFRPDAALAYSGSYTASVTTGARDVAGNPLAYPVSWTFTTADAATLTVRLTGTGSGVVTSRPAGIDCGAGGACSATFAVGTAVELAASPGPGAVFEGFGQACSSTSPACTLALAGDATVLAVLEASSGAAAGDDLALDGGSAVAVHQQVANPGPSPLDLSTFSIEAWIFPLADRAMLVAADSAYYLMIRSLPMRVELAVMTSTGFPAFLSFDGGARPLALGQWNHVVGMVDGVSRTLRVSVNGRLSGALAFGGSVVTDFPQTFSLGNSHPAALGDFPFVGRIDEVRLSSNIRYDADFTPSALLDADESTLGLWHFDEPTGATTFADGSGHGNDLSALGGAAAAIGARAVAPVASGSLVPGFGGGGVILVDPSRSEEAPAQVLVAGGALVVLGGDQAVGPQWHIEKRNLATGALVPTFGDGGVTRSDPSWGYDDANAAASDGTNLFIVGSDMVPAPFDAQWRIEKRLLGTGALVTSFGTNGVVHVNPSAVGEAAMAVVHDGSSIYVVGNDYSTGDSQWRIEKRSMSTGALVPGFGAGGVALSASGAMPAAAVLAGDSLVVAGWRPYLLGSQWLIERRSLETGALDPSFGDGGVISGGPAPDSQPHAIASDGSHLYVAGSGREDASIDFRWYLEKRDASTGALVPGFGNQGVVSSNPTPGEDELFAIALDAGILYLAGDHQPGGSDLAWRIEARRLDTGELVTDFGTGGVVTVNPSSGSGGYDERVTSLATDGVSLYLAGVDYGAGSGNGRWRLEKRAR